MNYIEIQNLSFTYSNDDKKALDDVNFKLNKGEMVVIMGKSGAGKSTFCRCLNGVIPKFQKGDFSGKITVLGEPTKDKRIYEIARNVGLVFQDFEPQLFSTSVELEVAFGPENLSLPREEISKRIKYALHTTGLEGFENRQPYNLSGGEKQRLAIASILSIRPKILVLDEPTTDLDPQGRYDIITSLKKLRTESVSLILVEQDAEDVIAADRIVIMDAGEIVTSGEPVYILTDIKLLEKHGIRPPQIARIFENEDHIPLTAEEAFDKISVSIDEEKYKGLEKNDEKRKNDYGSLVIQINDLRHSYPQVGDVLKGVDLEIREGEFVAIIGQNGSGKTTLAKHFNGLLRPSAGMIKIYGKDASKMKVSDLGRITGYVFQNPDHQIFASTVKEELAFGPENYGLSRDEIDLNIKEALEAVHLEGYEDVDPFSLTKGERQRVAVASILSCKPEILVLDEPTTGLDYLQQKSMMELLSNLNEAGHTIVIITHALWVVGEYAHRAAVMHDGSIIMDSTVRKAFSQQQKLESVGLKLPEIVRMGNMMGKTILSVEEYKYITDNK
ncbi:ATP-binding cassette domain-containing protein [Candidatus Poribacteria bacterium]|nr:ATP-binding cassette domain-containing protein [Candidatus Poribacteria bacterium]